MVVDKVTFYVEYDWAIERDIRDRMMSEAF